MRISFSIPLKPVSGKHKFAILLAEELKRQGVKITNKRPDVNLVFLKGLRKGCKNIFRLDGVWMNTSVSFRKKNKVIAKNIASCDGVVYQNNFCKKAANKFLGKFKNHAVILNGSKIPDVPEYEHPKPYILTFCRWRPHKRLKDTVQGFLHSGLQKDYDLLVLGEKADYIYKHPAVKYKGHQSHQLWSIIKCCQFVVHLAYVDWCPNSVVESLIAGKNVLHSPVGGTKELVRSNGISIKDTEWNFKPIALYSPPKVNMDELAHSYRDMFKLPGTKCDYLKIEHITNLYLEYCQHILEV